MPEDYRPPTVAALRDALAAMPGVAVVHDPLGGLELFAMADRLPPAAPAQPHAALDAQPPRAAAGGKASAPVNPEADQDEDEEDEGAGQAPALGGAAAPAVVGRATPPALANLQAQVPATQAQLQAAMQATPWAAAQAAAQPAPALGQDPAGSAPAPYPFRW